MAAPQILQGTLNRLRGSVTFASNPQLNVTASFLGEEGINLTPEGSVSDIYDTMTGTIGSPAPFQKITVEIELLKTQSFADVWKQQLEFNSYIGNFTVRNDASTLSSYIINNGYIMQASPGRLNGKSVGYMVSISGFYLINSSLYDTA